MNIDPSDCSAEWIAKEVFNPIEELLVREDEELKKVDQLIREAERKSKPILDPEP